MRDKKNIFHNTDKTLIWIYAILVLAGWLNIYASVYDESHKSIFDFAANYGKQLVWIVTSIVLVLAIMMTDTKFFPAFSYPLYGLTILLLIAVLFIGKEISGSKSWIQIGAFSLQPAEFAKLATSLALASYLGNLNTKFENLSTKFIAAILIGIPPIIIIAQNETGSALVFAAFILVLFREGLSGIILIMGFIAALLFVLTLLINKFIVIGIVAFGLIIYWLSLIHISQGIVR